MQIPEHNLVGFVVGTNYEVSSPGVTGPPLVSLYVMIFQDYLLFALTLDYVISFYLIRMHKRRFLLTAYTKQEKLKV